MTGGRILGKTSIGRAAKTFFGIEGKIFHSLVVLIVYPSVLLVPFARCISVPFFVHQAFPPFAGRLQRLLLKSWFRGWSKRLQYQRTYRWPI